MEAQLRDLGLEAVAAGCRAEAQRGRAHEAGYCFELFRRALEDLDQAAWAAVAEQYQRLILEWIYRTSPADPALAEEAARETIERFWRTLAGRCNPLAGRFPHVGALLKYLQQCAISTMLDQRRRDQQRARLAERIAQHAALSSPLHNDVEAEVLDRVDRGALIARARAWVVAEVADPAEQLIVRLSYVGDLSPAEIAARHPEVFANAAAVRQIKERVLRRARRALLDSGDDDSAALSGRY
jgi:RNA polymerase sigma factor (sigma-70 family)